jgi:hypothetical protein
VLHVTPVTAIVEMGKDIMLMASTEGLLSKDSLNNSSRDCVSPIASAGGGNGMEVVVMENGMDEAAAEVGANGSDGSGGGRGSSSNGTASCSVSINRACCSSTICCRTGWSADSTSIDMGCCSSTICCRSGWSVGISCSAAAVTSMPVDGLQQVHSDRGHLLDNGSQCIVCLLRGGGHDDKNRGGKGGSWATAASMVGGSKYQVVVLVLDHPAVAGKKDHFLILAYPITTHASTFYRWRRLKAHATSQP